jgi:hypothetical protein
MGRSRGIGADARPRNPGPRTALTDQNTTTQNTKVEYDEQALVRRIEPALRTAIFFMDLSFMGT